MDYAVLDSTQRSLRDEVFGLTAQLRCRLAAWDEAPQAAATREQLLSASAALAASSRQARIAHLDSWADLLNRYAQLTGHGAISGANAGIRTALGLFESVLEPCLEGLTRSRVERVDAALRSCVPEEAHRWIDIEASTFHNYIEELRSPPAPPVVAPPVPTVPAEAGATEEADEDDDFSRELLAAFREEVTECLERCDSLLVRLEKADDPSAELTSLFREFHTMKGAAAAVDLAAAAAQLHEGESLLESLRDGELNVERSALVDFLFRLLDSVKALINQSLGEEVPAGAVIADLHAELAHLLTDDSGRRPVAEPATLQPQPEAMPDAPSMVVESGTSPAADQGALLADLRRKATAGQLDPQLLALIDALDERARHYSEVAASLQEEVEHLRAVPAEVLLRRLERPVRDAARQEGKLVELHLSGEDVRLPRSIADRLAGPLLHLVRNAVAHGIEAPALRQAAGKPRAGNIEVSVRLEGTEIIVSVADDGGGLDLKAIRAKAAARGWVEPDRTLDEHVFIPFLFRPGFSTRNSASELAGRGVGLDVVAAEVEALEGWIEVKSEPAKGTRFTIYLARDGAGVKR